MELLGGQHRETRGEIEAHLRAEYRQRADPGAVVLPRAGIEDSLHQIEILVHPKRLAACRVPAKPVVQCRRPFGLSATAAATGRSEERRVGNEGVSTSSSRWLPDP